MEISLTKSKIFLYFCLSFVLGVLIASFLKIPILALLGIAIIAVILTSVFWREKKAVVAGLCLIFLALGIYRLQSVSDGKSFIAQYNDLKENVIFQGIVSEEPDVRIKDTQYVIEVKSLKSKVESFVRQPAEQGETPNDLSDKNLGKVLVALPHYPEYRYGDLIELEGKLKIPEKFNSFDYQEYLAKDGVYFTMYSPKTKLISSGKGNAVYGAIFSFKNTFKERLGRLLPEPEIALLNGLLLGERSGMSEKLKNVFSITGTSHIVAVSGFNVTIIAAIILELCFFIGFSRNQSFWVSLAAIIVFIIMVGAPSSAIRAGIMGGLLMLAMRTGRLSAISTAVAFAATIMIAANPKVLRFDVGFQLSFLAVMGIVWLYPVLDFHFRKFSDVLKIKSMFFLTVSAQIMALPILIYNFDRLSVVSPLANILILPFVPLAMAIGFLAGIFSFIWMAPAKIMGYFAWLALTYQIRAIEFLASFSRSSIEIFNFSVELFFIYYVILAIIIINFWSKKRAARIS